MYQTVVNAQFIYAHFYAWQMVLVLLELSIPLTTILCRLHASLTTVHYYISVSVHGNCYHGMHMYQMVVTVHFVMLIFYVWQVELVL
jgi:hypothetical protein